MLITVLMQIAFVLFAAAAVGGIVMTAMLGTGQSVPAVMGKGHGLAALAGLVLLFAANLLGEAATPALAWWAFVVLLSGFVGGITVIANVFHHRPPLWFVSAHGGLAALGLYLLGIPAF